MSLLIKGMDMPKLGENGDHLWVPSWIEVGKDGKAIICTGTHFDPNTIRSYVTEEVPTPHGDLIDRDDLLTYFDRKSKGKTAEEALKLLYTALKAYPTVIEKENTQ